MNNMKSCTHFKFLSTLFLLGNSITSFAYLAPNSNVCSENNSIHGECQAYPEHEDFSIVVYDPYYDFYNRDLVVGYDGGQEKIVFSDLTNSYSTPSSGSWGSASNYASLFANAYRSNQNKSEAERTVTRLVMADSRNPVSQINIRNISSVKFPVQVYASNETNGTTNTSDTISTCTTTVTQMSASLSVNGLLNINNSYESPGSASFSFDKSESEQTCNTTSEGYACTADQYATVRRTEEQEIAFARFDLAVERSDSAYVYVNLNGVSNFTSARDYFDDACHDANGQLLNTNSGSRNRTCWLTVSNATFMISENVAGTAPTGYEHDMCRHMEQNWD